MERWYTYILECADKTLYVGTTNNVKKRVAKHNAGTGAKYTRGRGPVKVRYKKLFKNRSRACKYESELKRLPRSGKLELINARENS